MTPAMSITLNIIDPNGHPRQGLEQANATQFGRVMPSTASARCLPDGAKRTTLDDKGRDGAFGSGV
jgi:hypothetical protein